MLESFKTLLGQLAKWSVFGSQMKGGGREGRKEALSGKRNAPLNPQNRFVNKIGYSFSRSNWSYTFWHFTFLTISWCFHPEPFSPLVIITTEVVHGWVLAMQSWPERRRVSMAFKRQRSAAASLTLSCPRPFSAGSFRHSWTILTALRPPTGLWAD